MSRLYNEHKRAQQRLEERRAEESLRARSGAAATSKPRRADPTQINRLYEDGVRRQKLANARHLDGTPGPGEDASVRRKHADKRRSKTPPVRKAPRPEPAGSPASSSSRSTSAPLRSRPPSEERRPAAEAAHVAVAVEPSPPTPRGGGGGWSPFRRRPERPPSERSVTSELSGTDTGAGMTDGDGGEEDSAALTPTTGAGEEGGTGRVKPADKKKKKPKKRFGASGEHLPPGRPGAVAVHADGHSGTAGDIRLAIPAVPDTPRTQSSAEYYDDGVSSLTADDETSLTGASSAGPRRKKKTFPKDVHGAHGHGHDDHAAKCGCGWEVAAHNFMEAAPFMLFVVAVAMTSLCMEIHVMLNPDISHEVHHQMEMTQVGFSCFFLIELAVHFYVHMAITMSACKFFKDPFNTIDTVTVVLDWASWGLVFAMMAQESHLQEDMVDLGYEDPHATHLGVDSYHKEYPDLFPPAGAELHALHGPNWHPFFSNSTRHYASTHQESGAAHNMRIAAKAARAAKFAKILKLLMVMKCCKTMIHVGVDQKKIRKHHGKDLGEKAERARAKAGSPSKSKRAAKKDGDYSAVSTGDSMPGSVGDDEVRSLTPGRYAQ